MMNFIRRIRDWLTDNRRVAIQGFLATIGVLAVQLGYATEDQTGLVLVLAGATMQLLQGLLALSFLRPSEAAVWFDTVGRALIYSFATALAPVAVVVGILTDVQTQTVLAAVSSGLTALSALVAVLNAQPARVTWTPEERAEQYARDQVALQTERDAQRGVDIEQVADLSTDQRYRNHQGL